MPNDNPTNLVQPEASLETNAVPTQTFTAPVSPTADPGFDSLHKKMDDMLRHVGASEEMLTNNFASQPAAPANSTLFGRSLGKVLVVSMAVVTGVIIVGGIGVLLGTHNSSQLKPTDSKSLLSGISSNLPIDPLQAAENASILQINRNTLIGGGKSLTARGDVLIQSTVNSADSFKVQNSEGSNILVADTKNNQINIGNKPPGNVSLNVSGDITTNGSLVSTAGYSLTSEGLTIGNLLVCTARGCISSNSPAPTPTSPTIDVANLDYLNLAQTFTGAKAVKLDSTRAFQVQNAAGSSNTFVVDSTNGVVGIGMAPINGLGALQVAGAVNASNGFETNGVAGSNFTCPVGEVLQQAVINGGLVTSGSCVTIAGGTTPSLQQVYDSSFPASIVLSNASGVLSVQDAASPLGSNLFEVASNGGVTKYFAVNSLGISVTGNVSITGQYQISGTQISSANLSNDGNLAKLNANQTFSGNNTFSSASNSFTGNGAGLTSLNASNISSGSLNDARLSANVALLNTVQTFTANNTFKAGVNSTTAFQIQNAAGASNLLIADTVNNRVGIGKAPTLGVLDVNGAIYQAGNQVCDTSGNCVGSGAAGAGIGGSGSTNTIPVFTGVGSIGNSILTQAAGVVTAGGSLNVTGTYQVNGSQIASTNLSDGANLAKLNGNQTFSGNNTFSSASNSFTGSGAGLTSLNASNISSGTLNDARLSANVALLNGTGPQTFSGNNKFTGSVLDQNASNSTTAFQIQNAAGTSNLFVADTTNSRVGIGKAPTLGTLDVNGSIFQSGNQVCDTSGNCVGTGGGGSIGGGGTAGKIALFTGSGFTIGDSILTQAAGTVTAAGNLNTTGVFQVSGSQISSANLSNDANIAKLNGNQTFSANNTFSSASNSFTGSGAGLTSLNASNVSSGTLGDARLSANVALLNANNTFTGNNSMHLNSTAFTVQDALSPLGADLFAVTDNAGTTKYFSVSATGAKIGANDICTTAGNCAGVGGGVTTTGGTINKLAKFTAGSAIGDSIITDNGSTVTIGGTLAVNTISPTAAMTIGLTNKSLTLQGDGTTTLTATASGITNSIVFAAPASTNKTITVPNATGTVAVSASGPLALDAAGNLTCPTCLTSGGGGGSAGVSSVNTLTGALTLQGTANQISVSSGGTTITLSTPQDIATGSSPTFANVNVTGQFKVSGSQIASANLSDSTNLAKLNGTGPQTFTGNNKFTGTVLSQNASNSNNAFAIQNATGTSNLFIADTTNTRLAVAQASAAYTLDVGGDINTTGVYRVNGSQINSSNLSDAANVALLNANQTFSGNNTFSSASNSFTGSGAGLTSLNASNVSSGTLNDARLSANVALLNAHNTFQNTSNAVNSFIIQNAAGTSNLFVADTTNTRLAVAQASANYTLDVGGDINTTGVYRVNGTALSSSNLSNDSNLAKLTANQTFSGNNTFSSASNSFTGNGSGLTSLNATNVSSGTLNDARLSANVALLNAHNNFKNTADSTTSFQIQNAAGTSNLFIADTTNSRLAVAQASAAYTLDVGGDINTTTGYRVGGTAGSTVTCSGGNVVQNAVVSGGIITGGSCVANGGGTTPTIATVYANGANQADETATLTSARGGIVIKDASTPIGADLFIVQNNAGSSKYLDVTSAGISVAGDVNITGQYKVSGTQISSANLSNDSNLAKLTANQTFSGNNTFSGTVLAQNTSNSTTAFQIQNTAGTSNLLIADTSNSRIGIDKAPTLGALDVNGAIYQAGNQVCDIGGNCAGTAGGGIGGGGTAGTIALFTGTGFTVGNSLLTQAGSTLTAGGNLTVSGSNALTSGTGAVALNGDTTVASGKNFTQSGGGTFSTGSGTNSLNGNTSVASNKSFTANGSATFINNTNSTTAFQIQNAAGVNLLNVDSTNYRISTSQTNLYLTDNASPTGIGVAAGSNQGGTLSGSGATTYFYKVSAIGPNGESLASSESSFNGASFTPITAPTAPTVAINVAAGNLNGTYLYKVTFVTANGETTGGTTSASVSPVSQKVDLTNIPLGPTGTTQRKIYRTVAGGTDGTQQLQSTINNNTATTLTDNTADGSLGVALPGSNTATTNLNNATVTWTATTGATSYRIYRGTATAAENGYQTSASSPFTDAGAAGTAGSVPVYSAWNALGVGTSSPVASLDIAGTAHFKNAVDNTTTFQVQNAGGGNLLNIDSLNSNITLGQGNLLVTGLGIPATPVISAGSNQGGTLLGDSTTYYYKVTAINSAGNETLASPEASIVGSNFTKLAVPTALTAAANASAGNVSCNNTGGQGCKYEVTFVTANGETTVGTASSSVLNVVSKQIDLTSIPLGPTGTTQRKIYRSTNNSAFLLDQTINNNTATTATDNVAAPAGAVPGANTATTNLNNATVTFTPIAGASSYRVYRGIAAGAESAYQTTPASPFTDTGAAGTSATTPTVSSVEHIGIGTASPTANLTVAGTALFQNAINTTSAFNIEDASGSSTLNVDTTNRFIGLNNDDPQATLDVIASSTGFYDGFETGTLSPFTSTGGWGMINGGVNVHAGNFATGTIVPGTMSITRTLSGAGNISFWAKRGQDTFAFKIDGATIITMLGGYQLYSSAVASGTHTFTWSASAGTSATGYVDDILITNTGAGTAALFNGGNVGIGTTFPNATLDVSGTQHFQAASGGDSANLLQVQNSFGANLINIDSTATANLLTNGDFEGGGTTGWAVRSGSTLTQSSSQEWQGNNSLSAATTTTAGSGATYSYTMGTTTTYSLSLYAKVASGSISDFVVGRQDVSGSDINCLSGQTLTTSWTRFTCTFTTGGTITNSNIYVNKSGGTAETFFIDGVQLQTGSTVSAFNPGGALQFEGIINSPVAIQNKSDSGGAFKIQNAGGSSLLDVDTANSKITVGQSNLVLTDLSAPTGPGVAAGSNQGGSLSGAAGITYYYKISALSGNGETLPSTESSINGASFTPLSAPAAANNPTAGAAGNVTCNNTGGQGCIYEVTFVTANGETTAGTPTASLLNVTSKQISLTGIPTGPSGTTARKVYRSTNGSAYALVNSGTCVLNDNTTTSCTDNVATGSLGAAPPGANTATTNLNNSTITWTGVSGATNYRIYRGTATGTENAYQTSVSSPFTDTGAAGTGGSVSTRSTIAQIGIGTSTPTANLDVRGNVLFKNTTDSTAAFQIQNAGGTSLLTADTSNSRVNIGVDTNIGTNFGQQYFTDNFEGGSYNLWDKNNGDVNVMSGSSPSTTQPHNGIYSAKFLSSASVSDIDTNLNSGITITTAYARAWVYISSQSSANGSVLGLDNGAGNLRTWNAYRNGGQLCVDNIISGTPNLVGSCGGSFTTGAWHLVVLRVSTDATGTAGTTQAWLDGTQIINQAGNQNNRDNSVGIARVYIGNGDQVTETATGYVDDVAVSNYFNPTSVSLNVDDALHVAGSSTLGQTIVKGDTGNIFQVQNDFTTFLNISDNGGGTTNLNTSHTTITPTNDNTTAFQVQNAVGSNALSVDTTAVNTLITNGNAEGNSITNWASKQNATVTRDTTQAYSGTASIKTVLGGTTAANDGVKYTPSPVLAATTYTLSFYIKQTAGTAFSTNLAVGWNNGSDTNCTLAPTLTAQPVPTTGWARYSCSFTGSTGATDHIYWKQTDTPGSARTFYIDAVQVETGSSATAYKETGLNFNGLVSSSMQLQNTSDSNTAFVINNSSGSNLLTVDTLNSRTTFRSPADNALAFQIQNANGTANLFTADTSGLIVTIAGNTTTFGNLTLTNAHFKSTQTNIPTIGTPTNCGGGTGPSATVTAGSTDSAGSFVITSGTTGSPTSCDTVFTFNKAYGTAPKSVLLTPQDAGSAAKAIYVSATSTTTFTVKFSVNAVTGSPYSYYYWVVE